MPDQFARFRAPLENVGTPQNPDVVVVTQPPLGLDGDGNLTIGPASPVAAGTMSAADYKKVQHIIELFNGDLSVENRAGDLYASGWRFVLLSANAYWDGSQWNRLDTLATAAVLALNTAGDVVLYTAPVGANPATLTERLNIKALTPTVTQVQVNAGNASLVLSGSAATDLAGNAYFDGINWRRYDTGQPASLVLATATPGVSVYSAPAGANPIAWSGPVVLTIPDIQKLQGWPRARLAYTLPSDWLNNTPVAANAQLALCTAQNFTVNSTTALLRGALRLGMIGVAGGLAASGKVYAVVDGATVVNIGSFGANAGAVFAFPGGAFPLGPGLAAGNHTIAVYALDSTAYNGYLRPASAPNQEFLHLDIVELSP